MGKCNNQFLNQSTLEFNSKTILNDHNVHLNYQKTPLLNTPLLVNSIKSVNNNFTNIKTILLDKIERINFFVTFLNGGGGGGGGGGGNFDIKTRSDVETLEQS
ncbi:hypothetical protein ACTA71_003484 [Dictyostelium dimigraforme]